jgi:opine dehydrogenase
VRGLHEGFVGLPVMTTDISEAIDNADLIMLVVPSVAHETYAIALAALIDGSVPILLNPGHTGGGLHFLAELRKAGYAGDVTIGETVTLTYICRSPAPGTVEIYSYTKQLGFAALPGKQTAALHRLVLPVFPELEARGSVLETGMSNINAIFHPPGMLMNAGWIEHTGGNFLFYAQGITESVGRVIMAVDAERLAVAKALDVPARSFLEIFHAAGLTTDEARDSGNVALACKQSAPNKSIKSPSSLDHRYVHEDVGDGLVAFSALGRLAGVPTSVIDAQVHLASAATGRDYWSTGLTLERMGLAGIAARDIHARLQEGL